MTLLECNVDVLRLILENLTLADLRSICLVHPCLRSLAEPLLYATVEIIFVTGQRAQIQPQSITALVRSLLCRPELAAHVRTLSCRDGSRLGRMWGRKAPKILVPDLDLRAAVSFVEGTRLSYRDRWIEELGRGTLDAYVAVLLSRLPRLQRLHLEAPFSVETELTGLVVGSITCGPRLVTLAEADISASLQELRNVHICRRWQAEGEVAARPVRNTENTLPFFHLPSLREMFVSIDDPLVPVLPWPAGQPPSAPCLDTLYVDSRMRESYLGQLLAATPRLRSLRWKWYFHPDFEDESNNPVVNLDQLIPALEQVRETLTELAIMGYYGHATLAVGPFPLRVQGSGKAFAGFECITKLFIPLVFLIGFSLPVRERLANCLPRTLEELTLTDDLYIDLDPHELWPEAGHTGAIVTWLAEDVKASTPRLRKLRLLLDVRDYEASPEDEHVRNEIRQLAKAAGIDVMVTHGSEHLKKWSPDGTPELSGYRPFAF